MSLFDKIKSAVMGNPVTREYEIVRHVASAGPGLLWKVHSGFKKSSRQEVSIFVLEKKAPEFEKMPKKQREAIYEMLKKGPTQLIKLRHPRLLRVEHQVEESGDCIAFVTEPIFTSLANILGHYDNVPTPLPLVIKEHQLHPLEIQYGLLQVAEALNFLHTDVKMMHGNLIPQNVVVTGLGNWKLMGFNFCCFSQYQSDAQTSFAFREWDTRKPLHTNPTLDYLAPEFILSKSCSALSDVFSFGMLSYAVYNGGRPLFENNNNMLSFKKNAEQVSRIPESALGGVPSEFKTFVRSMLAVEPSVRPDALQITKNPFFEEVAISTLKYLDSLFEKKDIDKSQFFKKNLARVITKLPKRMVHQRVLPPLSREFRNHKMIPFVLPLVLLVAEDCTLNEYSDQIMPILVPAMKIQDPIQVPLIFLQKMDLLLKMTAQDQVKQHVLPMITQSLEAEHSQLQELCVNILPSFASMVDYSSMKHSIIPRITALCLAARETSLRVKCLVSLAQMLDILDKHIVLDHLLPTLYQIPSREPGVLMAMLGIFHQTLTKPKLGLEKKVLAETIIPFLIPLSIEPTLNLHQFNQFMKVIREMLVKVETEQQAHLDQLSKMEDATKSTVAFAREVAETKAMDDALNRLEGMFSGSEPKEDAMAAPKRGDSSVKSGGSFSNSPVPTRAKTENSNFLSGVNLGDLSSTFSSNSTFPKQTTQPLGDDTSSPVPPSISPSAQQRSSPKNRSTGILQPSKSSSTSYQPPPVLKPQQMKTNLSSNSGDLLSGMGNLATSNAPRTGTGPSWSAELLVPNTSEPVRSSSIASWSIPTMASSSSGLGVPQQSSNQSLTSSGGGGGIFGGMNVNQSPNSTGRLSSGGNFPGARMSGPPPLVPVQSSGQSNAGMGWSSGVQGSSSGHTGMGTGQTLSPNSMGSGMAQQNQSQTGGGWSSNIAGSGSLGSSSGWSPGSQSGMGQQQGQMNTGGMGGNMGMSGGSMGQQQGQMGAGGMGMSGGNMGMGQQGQMGAGGIGMGGGSMGMRQQQMSGGGMGVGNSRMGMGQLGGQMGGGMGMTGGSMGMNQQGMAGSSMGMTPRAGSNMGMGQQGGSMGTGLGMMNLSSTNIQPQQPQNAASLMMGGAQPLIASPASGQGQAQQGAQKPASGPNPFANLNYRS